jgi:hypothetical protein
MGIAQSCERSLNAAVLRGGFFMPGARTIMAKKHPGFKSVQAKVEREGYSKQAAGAIVASAARNASANAKAANPNLKRVKGK